MLVPGVDVSHAPAVTKHVDWLPQALDFERAANHGEGGLRSAVETELLETALLNTARDRLGA